MYFGLSEDQAAIRDSVRGFARAKLAPGYLERAKSDRFPWDVHREIAGLGVFGLLAGEEFNPLPAEDFMAAGLAVEELAYADFNLANAAIPVMLMTALIGERTCACVVLRPGVAGLALAELTGYMRAQEIAPYKLPERLEIFAELPRTAGGKLSKVTLRSEVIERMAAR